MKIRRLPFISFISTINVLIWYLFTMLTASMGFGCWNIETSKRRLGTDQVTCCSLWLIKPMLKFMTRLRWRVTLLLRLVLISQWSYSKFHNWGLQRWPHFLPIFELFLHISIYLGSLSTLVKFLSLFLWINIRSIADFADYKTHLHLSCLVGNIVALVDIRGRAPRLRISWKAPQSCHHCCRPSYGCDHALTSMQVTNVQLDADFG